LIWHSSLLSSGKIPNQQVTGLDKLASKLSACSNNEGMESVYIECTIVLCYFKQIDFAHSADGMLIDVNWQHFLDSLSDEKLNRCELLSALASKVIF